MSTHKEWIEAKKGNSQHDWGYLVSSWKLINSTCTNYNKKSLSNLEI